MFLYSMSRVSLTFYLCLSHGGPRFSAIMTVILPHSLLAGPSAWQALSLHFERSRFVSLPVLVVAGSSCRGHSVLARRLKLCSAVLWLLRDLPHTFPVVCAAVSVGFSSVFFAWVSACSLVWCTGHTSSILYHLPRSRVHCHACLSPRIPHPIVECTRGAALSSVPPSGRVCRKRTLLP